MATVDVLYCVCSKRRSKWVVAISVIVLEGSNVMNFVDVISVITHFFFYVTFKVLF